jgi:hypothetical protein
MYKITQTGSLYRRTHDSPNFLHTVFIPTLLRFSNANIREIRQIYLCLMSPDDIIPTGRSDTRHFAAQYVTHYSDSILTSGETHLIHRHVNFKEAYSK